MLSIKELWEIRNKNSGEATDSARKLAFGAAAICWLFRSDEFTFSVPIYISLLFVSIFFLFDILQFISTTLIYTSYIKKLEIAALKCNASIDEIKVPGVPDYLNLPSWFFYIAKMVFLFFSYSAISYEFVVRMISTVSI